MLNSQGTRKEKPFVCVKESFSFWKFLELLFSDIIDWVWIMDASISFQHLQFILIIPVDVIHNVYL
jgi:hypothetical protein